MVADDTRTCANQAQGHEEEHSGAVAVNQKKEYRYSQVLKNAVEKDGLAEKL